MNELMTNTQFGNFNFISVLDSRDMRPETLRYRIGIMVQLFVILKNIFSRGSNNGNVIFWGIALEFFLSLLFMKVDMRYVVGVSIGYLSTLSGIFLQNYELRRRF
jgi:hypothetical protein